MTRTKPWSPNATLEEPAGDADGLLRSDDISELLPHRPPFLLLDRAWSLEPGESGLGAVSLHATDWYFEGHFPGTPIFPGVLIVEAMAQLAGVVVGLSSASRGEIGRSYLALVKRARFRRPVMPECELVISVRRTTGTQTLVEFRGEAGVANRLVASATVLLAV